MQLSWLDVFRKELQRGCETNHFSHTHLLESLGIREQMKKTIIRVLPLVRVSRLLATINQLVAIQSVAIQSAALLGEAALLDLASWGLAGWTVVPGSLANAPVFSCVPRF